MARPPKEGMDYFPHDTDASSDEKVDALRIIHGNDGYAFYFILLERIFRTADFELDISDAETRQILARKVAVTVQKFEELLVSALKHRCFDPIAYKERGVLTSSGIKKRAASFVEKRKRMASTYSNRVSAAETTAETQLSEPFPSRDKVKERKEEESKNKVNPPTGGEERECEGKPIPENPPSDFPPGKDFFLENEPEKGLPEKKFPTQDSPLASSDALPAQPDDASHTGGAGRDSPDNSLPDLDEQMRQVYVDFFQRQFHLPPLLDEDDEEALVGITKYLRRASKNKDDPGALSGWNYVFTNWGKIEPFLQTQLKLTQIKKNLNNIIAQILNGHSKHGSSNGKTNSGSKSAELRPNGINSDGREEPSLL